MSQTTALGEDALLLIGGVDSDYHPGTAAVLRWLLFEDTGMDCLNAVTRIPFMECVLLISKYKLHIYCPYNLRSKVC